MKNRIYCLLLVTLFLLLSGCSVGSSKPLITPTESPLTNSPSPTQKPSEASVVGTALNSSSTLFKVEFQDKRIIKQDSLFSFNGRLFAITSAEQGINILEFDPYNGQLVNEINKNFIKSYSTFGIVPASRLYGQIRGSISNLEYWYLIDDTTKKLYVFNNNFDTVAVFSLEACGTEVVFVSTDLSRLYYIDSAFQICSLDSKNQSSILYSIPSDYSLAVLEGITYDNQLLIRLTDKDYNNKIISFKPQAGSYTELLDGSPLFSFTSEGTFIRLFDDLGSLLWLDKDGLYDINILDTDEYSLASSYLSNRNHYISTVLSKSKNDTLNYEFRVYSNTTNGLAFSTKFLGAALEAYSDTLYISNALHITGDLIVGIISEDAAQSDSLYVWTYTKDENIDNFGFKSKYSNPHIFTHEVEADIKELEDEIENLYGIKVSIKAGEINGKTTFTTSDMSNWKVAKKALNTVKETLAKYPEGFFTALKSQVSENILLYLSDPIKDGIINANGYYNYIDETLSYICINGTSLDRLERDIYHEIWHAIDRAIVLNSNCNLYYDWNTYLPKGFVYDESFEKYNAGSNTDLTLASENNADNVWFVDNYTKTTISEDRARLAEALFSYGPDFYSAYPHLQDKTNQMLKELKLIFPGFSW